MSINILPIIFLINWDALIKKLINVVNKWHKFSFKFNLKIKYLRISIFSSTTLNMIRIILKQ